MEAFRTRIGKVTLKGGTTLHVLPDRRAEENDWLVSELLAAVEECVAARNGGMVGFALVTWGAQSDWSASVCYGEGSTIKDTLVPTFVGESLRRRLWTQDARHEIRVVLSGDDKDWT